ncbi:bifunctional pantoate--beta-alanine ligase/(d)CMP kinase [Spirulina major CS-329]|uniref:bifunctional pantoate--beta-alanine ligase/(d)CMP kinase n=1 Tax=Spirulina TaxID=1154 RepID=UPI00233109DE|nr:MULTISPECIES: bifunctional pantoate--beta-alanine ligase/(d)CMP kinase [Spirulina]MDB9493720.1 bifunctional pantoate--beta-alanine ligase/(d)CMP kinase [Spirulina subsalsa CS-330]MDB9505435.1 bifunctional pantoate--beta-alanine ligase/(d)CMP kinase [Spirulina major CS-329]
MRLLQTIAGLRAYLEQQQPGQSVGLVPTMGALHAGHHSLIAAARAENDLVVVSIFVNPLQFGPQEDLTHYPRTLDTDCEQCDRLKVDAVFAPSAAEMGIDAHQSEPTTVQPPTTMITGLCGTQRPGHFQGVATIVVQLFNLVQPTRAYFGQKDAQQLAMIRRIVHDLKLPVEIRPGAIVREPSGLAYSSRNQYLSAGDRTQAATLSRSLHNAQTAFQAGQREAQRLIAQVRHELAAIPNSTVDYVELVDPETLAPLERVETAGLLAIAVRLGSTRLIDNIILRQRRPIIAIDGPAGVGKSTVARQLAQNLNLLYLDTGAMYRAITWQVLAAGIDVTDAVAIAELASHAQIRFQADPEGGQRVFINDQDVTQAIRSPDVTSRVSAVASHRAVRQQLVHQQQQWGLQGGIVAEGRDIGTAVFPDAEVKIFLTASVAERARRRWVDLQQQGYGQDVETVEQQLQERDHLDSTREAAPLRQAEDAIALCTDGLTIPDVITRITQHYEQICKPSPTFQMI